jgi:hypothetical protein
VCELNGLEKGTKKVVCVKRMSPTGRSLWRMCSIMKLKITNGILSRLLSLSNDMQCDESHVSNFIELCGMTVWDTWRSPFMAYAKSSSYTQTTAGE